MRDQKGAPPNQADIAKKVRKVEEQSEQAYHKATFNKVTRGDTHMAWSELREFLMKHQ
jgi:hypothetical protein